MTLHQNLIAGEWVGGDGVANVNPSNTNDIVGEYARASAEDANAAIAAAKAAFPAWSRSGILERHAILKKTADEILARKEELGRLLSREEGKTLAEGIGETVRAGQIFEFFAGETLRLAGEVVPSVRPGIGVGITREPVGVVGIITPWNFPIAIPAWKVAPALCYGNTVVLKPAELVPGCSWAIVDILHRAGLPKGVLNLVMGKGSVVGQAMLDSPDVNAITFTGSTATGKRVASPRSSTIASTSWRWAARTRSSCSTTPISPSPSKRQSIPPSSRPASAAPPRRGSSSPRASMTGSSRPWASGSRVSSSTTR